MSADELLLLLIQIHSASLTASLPAAYAVYGDKFIRPTLERADSSCANLRSELTYELKVAITPFVDRAVEPVLSVILDDVGRNQPTASLNKPTLLEGEEFTEALRDFLDGESADFTRYRVASLLRIRVRSQWQWIRMAASVWPLVSLVVLLVIVLLSHKILPPLASPWLCLLSLSGLLAPIIVFGTLPFLAHAATRLEQLET